MESRRRGERWAFGQDVIRRSKALRACKHVALLMVWTMIGLLAADGSAIAQTTHYTYDANGRVVGVVKDGAASARYTYDTVGNLVQIDGLPAGQLAIFSFMPTHGQAGTMVTIDGQGFGAGLADNTVQFNGVSATVVGANPSELVAVVPDGATTGPISVTVGSATATSNTPFVIDDTGLPPTITQVSPSIVSIGDTVTVTGTHLYPVAGDTIVQMGGRNITTSPSATTDTQLQYVVPFNAASGNVVVQTPYGTATGAPVVVLPSGIKASSIASSGYSSNGSTVALNIGTAGQVGAVTFDAPSGGWASLQVSNIATSASTISYTVYAPGNTVVQSGTVSSSSPTIHLPLLVTAGTYLVIFQPNAVAQLSVSAEANVTLSPGVLNTVVTTVPGQSKRVLFQAAAGQNVAFEINGVTTSPASHSVGYTIYTPAGNVYTSATTTTAGVINLGNLPNAGTYQVVIAPGIGVTGSFQVQVAPGVTGVLNGTPKNYSANVAGQNVYLSFDATQGQNLELTLNNVNAAGASTNQFNIAVYNADGTEISSATCAASNPGKSCTLSLWYLPEGHYSVIATPSWGGIVSFTALLEPDLDGGDIPINGTVSIALAAGQVERYTFDANAGDTVALSVSGVASVPVGQYISFWVYRPDTGAILWSTVSYASLHPTSSQVLNLPKLPVGGKYTVIAAPNYGVPANAQLSLVAGKTGVLPTDGTPQAYVANVTAQNIYMSFTATQGQNLELTFNHINVAGATNNMFAVSVYNAAGTLVGSNSCFASNPGASCTLPLWSLPAGDYSVIASPSYGGVISFNAILQPDFVGGAIAMNGTANIVLSAGQTSRYTFSANAGDTVALNVSALTTTPAGQTVSFTVYRPDAGTLFNSTTAYTKFQPSAAQTVNLQNLPVSGTYTIVVSQGYGLPASTSLSVVSGVAGSLPLDGTLHSYAANVTGENVYLSFAASQDQDLELSISNVNVAGGSSNAFEAFVYNQAGAQVASFWCYATTPGKSCIQHLWHLAAGPYSVIVTPYYGGVVSFSAEIQPDIVGPALVAGVPANIALSQGQVERFTFVANVGDTVALNLSGVQTAPTGQPMNVWVYRPDTGAILSSTSTYTSFAPAASQVVNLNNLPASGSYTVIVSPSYGLPGQAQLTMASGVTGTLTGDGSSQGYTANMAGENVYMSFTATQNENLELTLTGIYTTGASTDQINVGVYNSAGSLISSNSCYASSPSKSCTLSLWYLNADTYTVIASPANGGVATFNAILKPDTVAGNLPLDTITHVSLEAGEVKRYTFNANAGDTVALNLSNVTTTPAGQNMVVWVYRPDVGPILANITATYSGARTATSQIVNLPNLPVGGAYTVIVASSYALPAEAQLSIASGTTGGLPLDGTAQSYTANTSGENVYLSFAAAQGQNLELTLNNLQLTGSTGTGLTVVVRDSLGNAVASYGCDTAAVGASCIQSLWDLAGGNYTVTVTPSNGGVLSFSALLQPDIDGGSIPINGTTNILLQPGQVERYTFTANAGDTVNLNAGVSTTPAGQSVAFWIYRPDTGAILWTTPSFASIRTTGTQALTLSKLPVSGNYTVIVEPSYGLAARAQLALSWSAGMPPTYGTPTLPATGTPQALASAGAGQSVTMTFNANAGDNDELTLAGLTINNGGGYTYANVAVKDPSGSSVVNFTCVTSNPNSSCRQTLWNLVAGTYSVVVSPVTSGATLSFNAILKPDTIGGALSSGGTASANLVAGEVKRFTFDASAGDDVALNLSGITTSPTGQGVYVTVYRPDVGAITPSNYYQQQYLTGSSGTVNLSNLPLGGTYTVTIWTTYGTPANAQLGMSATPTAAIVADGAVRNFSSSINGQNVYLAFQANRGDNLEFTLKGLLTNGSTGAATVNVYNSDNGTNIGTNYCYASNAGGTCRIALWNLAPGNYRVIVSPPAITSTMSFGAILKPDVQGGTLGASVPVNVNLAAGDVTRYTFTANTGDSMAISLSGIVTTPSGQNLYVNVYRPDGGAITTNGYYTQASSSSAFVLNLHNLPASGVYTVVVYNVYGIAASGQLAVSSITPMSLPVDGTVKSYQATVSGQSAYLTFQANTKDNMELTLSGLTLTGSSYSYILVNIYNPAGTNVGSATCYLSNGGGSCRMALWNLVAGEYTVVASSPDSVGKIGFGAQIEPDTLGGGLSLDVPVQVALGKGEVRRYTFDAHVGDNVAVRLAGASTTPAGQLVYAYIYRPDVGQITTSNYYTQFSTSSTGVINLTNLPESGTYTVVVFDNYGTLANTQLTIASGVGGPVSGGGASQAFATSTPGQNAYLNFNAQLGDNLELTLNGVTLSPTGGQVRMDVYNSHGVNYGGTYCYPTDPNGSCRVALWNLPADTYSMVVVPSNSSQTMSFNVILESDVQQGALTPGIPAAVNLGAGEVQRFTFDASLGDTIALGLSNVSSTPSGQMMYVNVYRPDTGALTTSNYYTQFYTSSSSVINLKNLPATGTYTAIVFNIDGTPATAQLQLATGAIGPVSGSGNGQAYAAHMAGQNVYLNFSANLGDNLELTLSGVTVSGATSTNSVRVDVYNMQGADIGTTTCISSNPGGGCRLALWNLDAGNYSVVVAPQSTAAVIGFNALLRPDTVDTVTPNVTRHVTLGVGEVTRLTFKAKLHDTITFGLSGVNTTPPGQTLYVWLYRPDTGRLTTSNYYSYLQVSSSGSTTVSNLPADGTYTAVLFDSYGNPASADLTVTVP